jgi:hypothetical protein
MVLWLFGGLIGCSGATGPSNPTIPGDDGGTIPSAPPAPPVEIPSFLRFPESVEIDVDKVGSSGTVALASLSIGDDISEAIEAGAKNAGIAGAVSRTILDRIKTVEVPVDPRVRTFQGLITDEGDILEIKIDFSRFDLNGDGADESCTGCTCPVGCGLFECPPEAALTDLQPICYRVWVRDRANPGPFERFLAGMIDRLPVRDDTATPENEDNAGNGRFRFLVSLPNPLLKPQPGRFSVSTNEVVYGHIDPTDPFRQSTEFSEFREIVQSGFPVPSTQESQHIKVEAEGLAGADSPDQVLKTIRSTTLLRPDGGGETEVQYLARYRDDADPWSGSAASTDPNFDFNFDSACASIASGLVTDRENCLTGGVDVGEAGLRFLGFVDRDGVAFPEQGEFPNEPTF